MVMTAYVNRAQAAIALKQGLIVWFWLEGEDEGCACGVQWEGWTAPVSYAKKWLNRKVMFHKRDSFCPLNSKIYYKVVAHV